MFHRMPHGRSFATVKFKVGGSGCFLYLAGADARGANADLFPHARHDRAHALQVRIPPAPPRVIRVADHVSKMRRFAAKLTLQCHFSSCFNFYLGLDFLLELSQNQAPHSSRPSTSGKARLLHAGGSARANWFRMVLRDDLPHLLALPPSSGPVLSDGIRTHASYQ